MTTYAKYGSFFSSYVWRYLRVAVLEKLNNPAITSTAIEGTRNSSDIITNITTGISKRKIIASKGEKPAFHEKYRYLAYIKVNRIFVIVIIMSIPPIGFINRTLSPHA